MSTEHTPEPWSLYLPGCREDFIHIATTGDKVWIGQEHTQSPVCSSEEDARRIIACVNACSGIEDPKAWIEALETKRDKYKAERDELLKNLEFFISYETGLDDIEAAKSLIAKIKEQL